MSTKIVNMMAPILAYFISKAKYKKKYLRLG